MEVSVLLQEFMKKLEEKRTELNKATDMGDALLAICHPDSITTIKHWITIIQARFEEVSVSPVVVSGSGSCELGQGSGKLPRWRRTTAVEERPSQESALSPALCTPAPEGAFGYERSGFCSWALPP